MLASLTGCSFWHHRSDPAATAQQRAPQLKSQRELSAERQARLARGEVKAQDPPRIAESGQPAAPSAPSHPTAPLVAGPGAIRGDVLQVNDAQLTVDEVLYPLWGEIDAAAAELSGRVLEAQIGDWVRGEVQLSVGSLLVYQQALGELDSQQISRLDKAVEEQVRVVVAQHFGDSMARFERDLAEHDMTLDAYRERIKRQLLVRSYTSERLKPKITIRRDELLNYYREHPDEFTEPQTRELRIIAAPFDAFLPEGVTWKSATRAQRLRAKLAAKRHIRAAAEALKHNNFADVARDLSRGPRASEGGSWGFIGRPLKPPYDVLSEPIFGYATGQTSAPIETDTGWYISGCGQIRGGKTYTFAESQDKIRSALIEKRFDRLASDYILRLADKATISNLRPFIDAAVKKAMAYVARRGSPGPSAAR